MTESERYGKWEAVKFIGRGGQGQVYLVRDVSGNPRASDQWRNLQSAVADLASINEPSVFERAGVRLAEEIHRIVSEAHAPTGALKKLLPLEEGVAEIEEVALDRMKQELSILEEVNHPSLVRVLDSDLDQNWFVMEYLEGGTLSDSLETYRGRALEALRALRPIVDAVSALHAKKVVHRDIKPDNIFVASDGHLVLADCGLAFRLENQDRLTLTFENVGTRDFQPPWSYGMRLADVQPAFDVFSLAKVLWAMVSGRPKFPLWYFGRPEHDLRQMFPEQPAVQYVHEILRKCVVELEDETRLNDAGELLREVDATIAALSSGCQVPGFAAKMRCRFCGIGTYQKTKNYSVVGNLNTGYVRNSFLCGYCGHLESFLWANGRQPPAWDESN